MKKSKVCHSEKNSAVISTNVEKSQNPKLKWLSIILSAAACIALVFGVTFGCLHNSSSQPEQSGVSEEAKTQPDDTSKYWDESDEIQALVTAGKTENQWQGSGTETDPFLISSALDLAWLSYLIYNAKTTSSFITGTSNGGFKYYYYKKTYFKQTVDIDVSKYWWQPIGIYYNRSGSTTRRFFSGFYDGDGHTVLGVFTKEGTGNGYSYQGLFGAAIEGLTYSDSNSSPVIRGITLKDSIINGYENVGGIAGKTQYLTIKDCNNYANVHGTYSRTGGIIGYAYSIANCQNFGDIQNTTGYAVGGICGDNTGSTVQCANFGNVEGGDIVGGIVGNSNGLVQHCYNVGNITALKTNSTISSSYRGLGGVVGYGTGSGTSCCFNLGVVNNSQSMANNLVGGVMGTERNSSTRTINIKNCFNLGSVINGYPVFGSYVKSSDPYETCSISNHYYGGDCQDLTSSYSYVVKDSNLINNAKTLSWYQDTTKWDSTYKWNFDTIWKLDSNFNDGYPSFQWQVVPPYEFQGEGTEASPYLISSEEDLRGVAFNVNMGVDRDAYFKQTADIRLTQEWTPIGTASNIFSGNYDGGNFTISGLFISDSTLDYLGLFGFVRSVPGQPVIKNVHIRDSVITSTSTASVYVGSVVASGTGLTIENCSSNAVISSGTSTGYVGGIVGTLGTNLNCKQLVFTGSITSGAKNVGGIVGAGDTISNCFNYGNVEGTNETGSVGGIFGSGLGSVSIKNCISKGILKTAGYAGSIMGSYSGYIVVENCAGYGMLYGTDATKISGIVGYIPSSGGTSIRNCSFVGSSNLDINLFYSAGSTISTLIINGNYAQVNDKQGRSAGDFSGFTIVENMNDNLPMQNALFSIAIGGDTSAEVAAYLEGLGFKEVA